VWNTLACGQITTTNDSGPTLTAEMQLSAIEKRKATKMVQQFGFASNPPADTDAVLLFLGGDKTNGLIIGTNFQPVRPRNQRVGEVTVYNNYRMTAAFTRDGITINADGVIIDMVTASGLVHITAPEQLLVDTRVTRVNASDSTTVETGTATVDATASATVTAPSITLDGGLNIALRAPSISVSTASLLGAGRFGASAGAGALTVTTGQAVVNADQANVTATSSAGVAAPAVTLDGSTSIGLSAPTITILASGGSVNVNANQANVSASDVTVGSTGNMTLNGTTISLNASASIGLNTPQVNVSGQVAAAGDVWAGAASLKTHIHSGGAINGLTGPPFT
jgi:phage gp45-like